MENYADKFKEQRREDNRQQKLHAGQWDTMRKCHAGDERFDKHMKDRAARNLKKKRKEAKGGEQHVRTPGTNHSKHVAQRKARKACLKIIMSLHQ